MSVTINLPADLERTVIEHAAKKGQDLSCFVVEAVREKIAKSKTFDEVCAPIRAAIAASGMNEEELDQFFNEAREEVWQEQQGNTP